MDLAAIPPGAWAAIGSVLGGLLLRFVEKRLKSQQDEINWRKDYRDEIKELNERLDKVEAEVNTWRERYYQNEEEIQTLRAFIIGLGHEPPERKPLPPKPV